MTVEVGLTGNIGAGKSTVARLLKQRGAVIVDADELVAAALSDPEVVAEVGDTFVGVVTEGRVDRSALAALVFADEPARRNLERIVHPRVAAATADAAARLRDGPNPPPMIVHDVPLLYEVGMAAGMDAVVVVDAPLELRVARVAAHRGFPPEQVRARDAAQWPAARKRALADVVIVNDGDQGRLEEQIEQAWPRLLAAAHQSR